MSEQPGDHTGAARPGRPKISKGFIPPLIFAVLGLVGGAAATIFSLQSGAGSAAERTPSATALAFVDAAFVQRDATRLLPFLCDQWSSEAVLRLVDTNVTEGTSVSPGVVEQAGGDGDEVRLRVKISVRDSVTVDDQWWQLSLVNQGGWRVCRAELIDAPSGTGTPTIQATPS